MEAVKTYSLSNLIGHPRTQSHNNLISEGILKDNSILGIAGAPKSFKSFLLDTILLNLATGQNMLNAYRAPHGRGKGVEQAFIIERPVKVLLFEQEVGEDDLEDRLKPIYEALPPERKALAASNFYSHSFDYTLMLDKSVGCSEIAKVIAEVRPQVVAFDPIIEFHTSNENDAQQMRIVTHNMDELRQTYKLALIFSHHMGKEQAGNPRSGLDLFRGSSVIGGKVDSGMLVQVHDREALQVKIDFVLRRGKPIQPLYAGLDDNLQARFICWNRDPEKKEKLAKLSSETDGKIVQ